MYCKNCGKQLPDGAQYCDGCGARQVAGGYVTYTQSREPKPSVNFIDAVKLFFTKYADFNTRSRRSEYWWSVLFCAVASSLAAGILKDYAWIWSLVVLIPTIAISVRRLHDIGKAGTCRMLLSHKIRNEGMHARSGKQNSGVILRDQRGAGDHGMSFGLKEIKVELTQLRTCEITHTFLLNM